jgi:hypothetical protein
MAAMLRLPSSVKASPIAYDFKRFEYLDNTGMSGNVKVNNGQG